MQHLYTLYVYIHIYRYVDMYLSMSMCTYKRLRMYTRIHIHTHIHIYIYTYTYMEMVWDGVQGQRLKASGPGWDVLVARKTGKVSIRRPTAVDRVAF